MGGCPIDHPATAPFGWAELNTESLPQTTNAAPFARLQSPYQHGFLHFWIGLKTEEASEDIVGGGELRSKRADRRDQER